MRDPNLRLLTAGGDAYAIGRALGAASANVLRDVLLATDRYRALTRTWRGTQRLRDLESSARATWPRYVREIEGIADGAGVAFETMFLWNCRGDVPEAADRKRSSGAAGGTTVAIPSRGRCPAVIAHNADDEPEMHGHCRIVEVRPDDAPGFVAFYSPGLVPGHAFAVNCAGLVQTVNDVSAEDGATGVPGCLVCRAVLDCEGLDDAIARIRDTVRASGFHHSLGQAGDRRLLSVEAPARGFSVMEVNGPRAHANHLLHDRFTDTPRVIDPSSRSRQTRAEALIASGAIDGSDPLSVLADVGIGLPIRRREKDAGDSAFTLATAVFRISETGVDYEVFDDLLHPPTYRGEVVRSPAPLDPPTGSARARGSRGPSAPVLRRR